MRSRVIMTAVATVNMVCVAVPSHAEDGQPFLDREAVTRVLSRKPDDPLLNFLNGLAYEGSAAASSETRELARVGYAMALRQDPGFWRAAYQLGLMSLDDRDSAAAESYLLEAARNAPYEPRIYEALARASYCAGDMELAAAALAKAVALGGGKTADAVLTSALIKASRGERGEVEQLLPNLSPLLHEAVETRLAVPREPAQAAAPASGAQPDQASPSGKRMAVVDVVIIRRNEYASSKSGINLLDSLSLQLGSNLINRSWDKTLNRIDGSQSTNTVTSNASVQLTIPAVTYSLNLANARGNSSRIEARPSILVYEDTESKIFDGGTLTFATDGQLTSSSETREVGLSLSVTPKFIAEDSANLSVTVTLENFVPTAPVGTFRQAVQTEKSSTQVAADVRFGQTMLVSGGSSANVTKGSSRTPVAGSIPLLGKLFSTQTKYRQDNELLILLSLRPVPGRGATGDKEKDKQGIAHLRDAVFPGLPHGVQLATEQRQIFYKSENPAYTGTAAYLNPIAPTALLREVAHHRDH